MAVFVKGSHDSDSSDSGSKLLVFSFLAFSRLVFIHEAFPTCIPGVFDGTCFFVVPALAN